MANCITPAITQKLPEELSAVAETSCAPRSWHTELAALPFAVLVAAVSSAFGSQAVLSVGCRQTAAHLEMRDRDAKRI